MKSKWKSNYPRVDFNNALVYSERKGWRFFGRRSLEPEDTLAMAKEKGIDLLAPEQDESEK